jgi:hypothetical protein
MSWHHHDMLIVCFGIPTDIASIRRCVVKYGAECRDLEIVGLSQHDAAKLASA